MSAILLTFRDRAYRLAKCELIGLPVLALLAMSAWAAPDVTSNNRKEAVDQIFSQWGRSTPGCAAGVAVNGATVALSSYGMADLERDVEITPETIFEIGSVSKQFTAAAVLLLARDGRLSLDDFARKYIPELPDYAQSITLRQLLTHTSGLRDWGSVVDVAGWPRGTRQYTHAHVLDIVTRQQALNFAPGTRFSYSNTGYNLAAIIVERVSGMSLQEFSQRRLFEPLGMRHSSWRDDHTRIVKGRAIAYNSTPTGFRVQMPFENVYGNCGLMTTVEDLLKWNEHFWSVSGEDASLVRTQEALSRLKDGHPTRYALGLIVSEYRGELEVSHSGATAGYRAFLARYPRQHLSVAVLCNGGVYADGFARALVDLFAPMQFPQKVGSTPSQTLSRKLLDTVPGIYRSADTGVWLNVMRDGQSLRLRSGTPLTPLKGARLSLGGLATFEITEAGVARLEDGFGGWDILERVDLVKPKVDQLQVLTGTFVSAEADVTATVSLDGETLVLTRGVNAVRLVPLWSNAFGIPGGVVTFLHDEGGAHQAFTLSIDRLWNLRFVLQPSGAARERG